MERELARHVLKPGATFYFPRTLHAIVETKGENDSDFQVGMSSNDGACS